MVMKIHIVISQFRQNPPFFLLEISLPFDPYQKSALNSYIRSKTKILLKQYCGRTCIQDTIEQVVLKFSNVQDVINTIEIA